LPATEPRLTLSEGQETDVEHTYTMAEALIVAVLAALFGGYLYIRHRERVRRLEIIHQERLVAMEKGIPLPELPLDPTKVSKPSDPRAMLLHGIAWTTFGFGGVVALFLIPNSLRIWPLALPLMFLGLGLIIYYALGTKRTR
jgi:hypothetical protein